MHLCAESWNDCWNICSSVSFRLKFYYRRETIQVCKINIGEGEEPNQKGTLHVLHIVMVSHTDRYDYTDKNL